MKGQTMEMLGFLILSVTIIIVIVFMRTQLAGTYGRSFSSLVERQEVEGFRAGATSVLQTTEDKTGKTLLELLGIASYNGGTNLNFGPSIGKVDLKDEIEWRMDQIYGKGKWYIKIPYPDVIPRYQIVIILDTSGTLCDDFQNIKETLPTIIEDLRKSGYNVAATIYMLPGGSECCGASSGKLKCEGLFSTERYLHCIDLDQNSLSKLEKKMCTNKPQMNEDWGRGLACAIEIGPYEGWYDFTAKIGIVVSDELPMGSEGEGNSENQESLNIGKTTAVRFGMKVFPLKADTGKRCCPSCDECPSCKLCVRSGGIDWFILNKDACEQDQRLSQYMQDLASATGGTFYELDSPDVSLAIKRIFEEHKFDIKTYLEIGTQPPSGKKINSLIVPTSVPFVGGYANIYIYTWT